MCELPVSQFQSVQSMPYQEMLNISSGKILEFKGLNDTFVSCAFCEILHFQICSKCRMNRSSIAIVSNPLLGNYFRGKGTE